MEDLHLHLQPIDPEHRPQDFRLCFLRSYATSTSWPCSPGLVRYGDPVWLMCGAGDTQDPTFLLPAGRLVAIREREREFSHQKADTLPPLLDIVVLEEDDAGVSVLRTLSSERALVSPDLPHTIAGPPVPGGPPQFRSAGSGPVLASVSTFQPPTAAVAGAFTTIKTALAAPSRPASEAALRGAVAAAMPSFPLQDVAVKTAGDFELSRDGDGAGASSGGVVRVALQGVIAADAICLRALT